MHAEKLSCRRGAPARRKYDPGRVSAEISLPDLKRPECPALVREREWKPIMTRVETWHAKSKLAAGAWIALAVLAMGPAAFGQTLFDGKSTVRYSQAQAGRGEKAYQAECQSCHGAQLNDGEFGPALKGTDFRARWARLPAVALFNFIREQMPPSGAGTLSPTEYADIEAYILQANDVPPGDVELSAQELVQASSGAPQGAPTRGPDNYDAIYHQVEAARTAKLDALAPVSDAMLQEPADGDWLTWRRSYASTGFSPLAQISAGNVAQLRSAWSWTLPESPDEIAPIAHDGVLFVESADQIQALDGATGSLLWKYVRPLADSFHNGRQAIAKNMAIYGDRIFAPTADGHLVALDIRTGKPSWDHEVLGPPEIAHRLRLDGGPVAVKGKIIVGASGCNTYRGGCFIVALDAKTGAEVWRFNAIARPGQPGGDSWNGAPVDQRYGGSVWTSGSYDPDTNLLYFGIGQTYDTGTLLSKGSKQDRENDAAYTDSTVALDPDSGKLIWYYQHFNRDVWDFDWVFEQTLLDLPVAGKPRKLLITGGKIAIFDTIDRQTGRYLRSQDLGLQNIVTAIDPKTGRKTVNPEFTPEADKAKLICPHAGGARSWPATAYDPQTKMLYVPLVESCMQFTWRSRSAAETAAGGSDIGWVLVPRPGSDGKFGRVEAVNMETGSVSWTVRRRAPETASILATGGGLVFDGSRDRVFRASDARTGKVLWETRLNAVPSSTPITYSAGGAQYVAVVAGGGGAHEATWPTLTPEIQNPAGGTTLWVFKLGSVSGP